MTALPSRPQAPVVPMARVGRAPPPAPVALGPGDIHLGDFDIGGPIGLDLARLLDGRLLIQGVSGAGKSWTLRRLLEQTHGLVQQVVVDPEGEFRGLEDELGLVRIAADRLDAAALAVAASRARKHRASVLLDVSDLDRQGQMIAVTAFLDALVAAPREHWHPCLVALDEAHLFAPFGGNASAPAVRKAAIGAVTDLVSRGRKRGLAGIIATQRLARLSKSVASEVHNFLIGLNTLDLDIRRAAETIGWDARKGFDRLPMLSPGDFVAVGPAFSRSPAVLHVGPVRTVHRGMSPALATAPPPAAEEATQLLDLEALAEASAEDAALREAPTPGLQALRAFILEPAFPNAARIWEALRPLAPDGAAVAELGRHLELAPTALANGLALLDRLGVLEFSGEGDARAVRIERAFAGWHLLRPSTGEGEAGQ